MRKFSSRSTDSIKIDTHKIVYSHIMWQGLFFSILIVAICAYLCFPRHAYSSVFEQKYQDIDSE